MIYECFNLVLVLVLIAGVLRGIEEGETDIEWCVGTRTPSIEVQIAYHLMVTEVQIAHYLCTQCDEMALEGVFWSEHPMGCGEESWTWKG